MKYLALVGLLIFSCSKEPSSIRSTSAVINHIGNCFVSYSDESKKNQFPFGAAAICNVTAAKVEDDAFRKAYVFNNCVSYKDDGYVCFPVPYGMIDTQTKKDSLVLECSK